MKRWDIPFCKPLLRSQILAEVTHGAAGEIRTHDLFITNELLYP